MMIELEVESLKNTRAQWLDLEPKYIKSLELGLNAESAKSIK